MGGAVLAVLLGWMDATVVPTSIEQARDFREKSAFKRRMERRTKPATGCRPGPPTDFESTYDNRCHRHWFINQYSTEAQPIATGVSIYEFDDPGQQQ